MSRKGYQAPAPDGFLPEDLSVVGLPGEVRCPKFAAELSICRAETRDSKTESGGPTAAVPQGSQVRGSNDEFFWGKGVLLSPVRQLRMNNQSQTLFGEVDGALTCVFYFM